MNVRSKSPFRAPPGAALLLSLILLLPVSGCAPGREFANSGDALIKAGRYDEGLAELEKAMRAEPDNREYRIHLVRQREIHIADLLQQADSARVTGQLPAATSLYRNVLDFAPGNARAQEGLGLVEQAKHHQALLAQARKLADSGQPEAALARLRGVLDENPRQPDALALKRRLEQTAASVDPAAGLSAALRKTVSLEFRDANIKSVFEALARSTGVNFVFDREVRADIKVSLFITNVSVDDVINVITTTNQLSRSYLSDNTVLIYPNTPAKQKDYQALTVRTFYLANADAKQMMGMLRAILKTRDLYADDKLNSITLRDTPEAVRLAEKLIAAQDLPEPEVVLEVEILEVKRSRLTELGIDLPTQFTALNIVQNPSTVVSTATGTTTVVDNTVTTTQMTLDKLRHINGTNIGINNPSVNARSDLGDTNLLANPRIRVRNRDKARILIGDRVPVITTTSTANVGVSESVNFLDVGLKLDVEPNVYLDDEVGIKVALEVSSIVKEVKSKGGTLTYQIGTRLASTSLRLKDGETQALAGLISDEDRQSATGLPGLIDLPLAGRLFSNQTNDRTKTEIVLLITPHVVRGLGGARAGVLEYASGTESALGVAPMRLRGDGKLVVPMAPPGGPVPAAPAAVAPAAAPVVQRPEPPEEPAPSAPAEPDSSKPRPLPLVMPQPADKPPGS